jgi:hypothetical protein
MLRGAQAVALVLTIALGLCGGEIGCSGTPTPVFNRCPDFPTLVQSADFGLPKIVAPPEHPSIPGSQRGKVRTASTSSAVGLTVELLDATLPASTVVLAASTTDADGSFSLTDTSSGLSPVDRWIRVTLADGTFMRAYATGWTEITPGTEAAVSEIARLRKAGAFTAHHFARSELAGAQESFSLVWQSSFFALGAAAAANAVREYARFHPRWNRLLENVASASASDSSGDIAGMFPLGTATWPSEITRAGITAAVDVITNCLAPGDREAHRYCSIVARPALDLTEQLDVSDRGIVLHSDVARADVLQSLVQEVGDLPLLEFPYAAGTRVLFDNPRLASLHDSHIGSLKITRRTYSLDTVQALGGSVQAVQVVLDYELASVDCHTGKAVDVLARERRWFSPLAGRVRAESAEWIRADGQVTSSETRIVANSISGDTFFGDPVQPFAGVADVQSLALRHRHAVHSRALDRIFVGTDSGGGSILELDPNTLATIRSTPVPAAPGRLAVSGEGSRLYAGMDGGKMAEIDTATLGLIRVFDLPPDPYGAQYDRAYDMSVDPFDPSRLLVLSGRSTVFGSTGAVLLYRAGSLLLRDAPRYYASDYGWGFYSLNAIAWSGTRDEFLGASLGSPQSLFRFHAGANAFSDVAALARVDDVGLIDVGGEIVTSKGKVLDAQSLTTLRTLSIEPFGLKDCNRLEDHSDLCGVDSGGAWSPPFFVHLDHSTGAFLGTYRPFIAQVANGCPEIAVRENSLGLDEAVLRPMGDGRSLVVTLPTGRGSACGLQVWRLHGAYP